MHQLFFQFVLWFSFHFLNPTIRTHFQPAHHHHHHHDVLVKFQSKAKHSLVNVLRDRNTSKSDHQMCCKINVYSNIKQTNKTKRNQKWTEHHLFDCAIRCDQLNCKFKPQNVSRYFTCDWCLSSAHFSNVQCFRLMMWSSAYFDYGFYKWQTHASTFHALLAFDKLSQSLTHSRADSVTY